MLAVTQYLDARAESADIFGPVPEPSEIDRSPTSTAPKLSTAAAKAAKAAKADAAAAKADAAAAAVKKIKSDLADQEDRVPTVTFTERELIYAPLDLIGHLIRFFGLFRPDVDIRATALVPEGVRKDNPYSVGFDSEVGYNFILTKPRINLSIPPPLARFLVGNYADSIYAYINRAKDNILKNQGKTISTDFNSLTFFIKCIGGVICSFKDSQGNERAARRIYGTKEPIHDPERLSSSKVMGNWKYIPYYEKNSYKDAKEGMGSLINSFFSIESQSTLWSTITRGCFEAVNEIYCELDFPDNDVIDSGNIDLDNESNIIGPPVSVVLDIPPQLKTTVDIGWELKAGEGNIAKKLDSDTPISIVGMKGKIDLYFEITSPSSELEGKVRLYGFNDENSIDIISVDVGNPGLDLDTMFPKDAAGNRDVSEGTTAKFSGTLKAITNSGVYKASLGTYSHYFFRYNLLETVTNYTNKVSIKAFGVSIKPIETDSKGTSPNRTLAIAEISLPSGANTIGNGKKIDKNKPDQAVKVQNKTGKANANVKQKKSTKTTAPQPKKTVPQIADMEKSAKQVPVSLVYDAPTCPNAPFYVCCRIKPFVTRGSSWGMDFQDGRTTPLDIAREMSSYFQDVARVLIPMESIISIDAGTNIRDAVNFVQVIQEGESVGYIKLGVQTFDTVSIERIGLRPRVYSASEFSLNQFKAVNKTNPIELLNAWKYLNREWYGNAHNYLNGQVKIHGMDYYIPVGHNIVMRAEALDPSLNFNSSNADLSGGSNMFFMAHVESVSHSFTLGAGGGRSYITTVSFTTGIFCDKVYLSTPTDRSSKSKAQLASFDTQIQDTFVEDGKKKIDYESSSASSFYTRDKEEWK